MQKNRATSSIVGLLAIGSQCLLVACGGTTLPAGPVVVVTPTSWDYTTDPQTYAVYVGVSPHFSAQIENPATNPLTISSVKLADPSGAFALVMPSPGGLTNNDAGLKTTVNGPPDSAVVQVIFSPTATIIYDATITITTNGVNDGGVAVIKIHALGVQPDGGIPADAGVLGDAGLYVDGG